MHLYLFEICSFPVKKLRNTVNNLFTFFPQSELYYFRVNNAFSFYPRKCQTFPVFNGFLHFFLIKKSTAADNQHLFRVAVKLFKIVNKLLNQYEFQYIPVNNTL